MDTGLDQSAHAMTPEEQREAIKRDLLGKFQREDWHGVMDAAVDLREHDAYQRGAKDLVEQHICTNCGSKPNETDMYNCRVCGCRRP